MAYSLELKNVSKYYLGNDIKTNALDSVSLRITKGEFVSIVGSSGSGKSTLLSILGTLDRPSQGEVLLNDENITSFNTNQLADIRFSNIGFIFQQFHLLPAFTILENTLAPLFHRRVPYNKIEKAKEILYLVGLEDKINSLPSQLSGGQQQRAAIARAIITDPDWILADEPTGNLDTETGKKIFHLLNKLNIEKECGVIYVTHDMDLADLAYRKIRMKDGAIISDQKVASR